MVRRRPTITQTPEPIPVIQETPEELQARNNIWEEEAAEIRAAAAERERLHPSIMCRCGMSIDARHLERHQRSKTHDHQLKWYMSRSLTLLRRNADAPNAPENNPSL
jgi:hypothetical protein